jgi:hypothetical protein
MSCSADDDDDQFCVPNISPKTRIKKLIVFLSNMGRTRKTVREKKKYTPRNLQIYLSIFLHV